MRACKGPRRNALPLFAWLTVIFACTLPCACVVSRVVHGSRVYRCSDPSLFLALVSVLCKMANSPMDSSVRLADLQRPLLLVEPSPPYQWNRVQNLKLRLTSPLHHSSTKFVLLQDYSSGADGRVWLVAAQSSGALGVVKFPKPDCAVTPEEEAQRWSAVWKQPARVVVLAGQRALLMPFAFHAHADSTSPTRRGNQRMQFLPPDHLRPQDSVDYLSDVSNAELTALCRAAALAPRTVAQAAVRAMAEAGYEHEDMHWRHVAFIVERDSQSSAVARRPVLIDLTRIKQLPARDEATVDAAVSNMMEALDASKGGRGE